MNATASSRKCFAAMLLGLLPVTAWASLEADRACEGNFCWSVAVHRSEKLKDYYFYVRSQALKHLVIRYQSGAQINVLMQDMPAKQCDRSFLEVTVASLSLVRGKGCLVTKQRDKAVRLSYEVSAVDVDQLLHKVAPVLWLSGYSETGDFLPAASVLLPLDGARAVSSTVKQAPRK